VQRRSLSSGSRLSGFDLLELAVDFLVIRRSPGLILLDKFQLRRPTLSNQLFCLLTSSRRKVQVFFMSIDPGLRA